MKLGALILHGLTSSLDCVNGLVPYMERNGIPFRMPVLRGHMTKAEDLIGVTWHDWYADGKAALLDLCRQVDKAVVIGLSMGGLVALQLAMEHADKVDSVVTVAGAMRMKNPGARQSPCLPATVGRSWSSSGPCRRSTPTCHWPLATPTTARSPWTP